MCILLTHTCNINAQYIYIYKGISWEFLKCSRKEDSFWLEFRKRRSQYPREIGLSNAIFLFIIFYFYYIFLFIYSRALNDIPL